MAVKLNSNRRKHVTILQSQSLELELVTIVIKIDVVIAGFSGEELKWLAHLTVRLQPTVPLHAVYAPIIFVGTVIVMINSFKMIFIMVHDYYIQTASILC